MSRLVPDFILNRYRSNNLSGNLTAFTMFTDISGFTQMTQALMNYGKEGAEILSQIINEIFTPSIQRVYDNGGFVSSFAGDSFTAIFQTEKAEYPLKSAFEINKLFMDFGTLETKYGKFELTVKIGLSYGAVRYCIIETDKQNTWYFRGEAIDNCAKSENKAEKMQIISDTRFTERLSRLIKIMSLDDKWYLLMPEHLDLPEIEKLCEVYDGNIINKFIPRPVLESGSKGEFRSIVSSFIGISENGNFLDGIRQMIMNCHDYGGYFNRVTFGDKGCTALILFGAPVGWEKLSQRAIDFLLSLKDIPDFIYRAGITTGISWAGFAGSQLRSEYTALGNNINLSARLMRQAEWGQILSGPGITDNLSYHYRFKSVGSFRPKGFNNKIELYEPESKMPRQNLPTYTGKFIGRTEETDLLKELTSPVFDKVFGGIIYIDGHAGIGKSRFITYFTENILNKGCSVFNFNCDGILKKPFNPFTYFFRAYFAQAESDNSDNNKQAFETKYQNIIDQTKDNYLREELIRTESIIGSLIGLEWDNSLYSQLDPKGRYENTLYAVRNLLLSICTNQPLILVFDDIQWIDEDSRVLIRSLVRNVDGYPFIILALTRPLDDGSLFNIFEDDAIKFKRLELEPLNRSILSELIYDRLKTCKNRIPKETEDFIREKSEGNPFFAEQIILYLKENNFIDDALDLKAKATDVPAEINQIIIARIDRLSAKMKATIKTASVLGREFALNILQQMLSLENIAKSPSEFFQHLQDGNRELIWEPLSELIYIFKHALIRDAVYEMQLKNSLRKLHNLAGSVIEDLYRKNINEYYHELADHYEKADNLVKAVEYLEKAGDQAGDNYQNLQAIDFYDRLLRYLDDDNKIIYTLIKKGKIYSLIGKWDFAEISFRESIKRAEKINNDIIKVDCVNALGRLLQSKGSLKEAMQLLQSNLKLALRLNYKQGIGCIFGNMGIIHWNQGDYIKAIEYYEKNLAICEENKDKKGISTCLGNIGLVHWNLGSYDKAMEFYTKQLSIAEATGDKREIACALGNIGIIYWNKGNSHKAMACYEKLLSICDEIGDRSETSIAAIGNLGYIYANMGKIDNAMECYSKQLSISEEIGNKRGISYALGNMGVIYSENGNYDKAMECYKRNLSICEETGDKSGISSAIGNIGHIYTMLDNQDKAMEYFQKQLAISQEIGDKIGISYAAGNMGCIYAKQNIHDKSKEYIGMQLSISEEIGNKMGISHATGSLGYLSRIRGEYDKAMEYFKKQLEISEEIGYINHKGSAMANIGFLYLKQCNYDKAIEYLDSAIAISRTTKLKFDLCSQLYYKARALFEKSLMNEAECANSEAMQIADAIKKRDIIFLAKILKHKIDKDHKAFLHILNEGGLQPEQTAVIFYELWKLTGKNQYKIKAKEIYIKLLMEAPIFEFKQKLKELSD